MPRVKKEESSKNIKRAIDGIKNDFNENQPILNYTSIAKKYKISLGTISKIVIPTLQATGFIEIEKRRAGFYYNTQK